MSLQRDTGSKQSGKPVFGLSSWFLILGLLFALLLAGMAPHAHGYHFPWDQGHDTTTPDSDNDQGDAGDPPGPCESDLCDAMPDPEPESDPEPEDPCDGPNNNNRSPITVATGHFQWRETDVVFAGRPLLSLHRTYNSHDPRDGMFGNGWISSCEGSLYRTVKAGRDEGDNSTTEVSYQLVLPNGKRYRYDQQEDGSLLSPARRYDRLEPQQDGTVVLVSQSGAWRQYAASGELMTRIDRTGNARHYRYDDNNRLVRLDDDQGRFLTFRYNSTGRVSEVQDHGNRRWYYDYDDLGNLVMVTDPMGGVRQYEYQRFVNAGDKHVYHQLTRVVDAGGATVIDVTYNGVRATSYTEGENRYTYSYNANTRTVTKTDSAGTTWQFLYNDDQVVIEDRLRTSSGAWRTYQYEYDDNGNKVKTLDPASGQWLKAYDDKGRLLSRTNPLGESITYTYQGDTPWPVTITSPSGREAHYSYNDQGNPLTITDPLGQVTALTWNDQGDLLSIKDALGRTTTMTYDDRGQLLSVTDAENRTVTYQYDALGRRVQSTAPNGDLQQWAYDDNDRLVSQRNGLSEQVSLSYDGAGRLISVTDGEGETLYFDYDDVGRLISERRPDGQTLTFQYRADNLLASKQTPNGDTISYQYDPEKRLTRQSFAQAAYHFTYTALGQLAGVSGGGSSHDYRYDAAGRLIAETQQGRAIAMSYNADGEADALTLDGEQQTLTRNDRGQITGLVTPAGQYQFSYDEVGQLTTMQYPGGQAQYGYNQSGQLSQQAYTGKQYGYQYDQNGRLDQKTAVDGSSNWLYGYDGADRLAQANLGAEQFLYQYDKNSNRQEQGQQYNAFNTLLSSQGRHYSNDASGNRTEKVDVQTGQVTAYQYDALNRLMGLEIQSAEGVLLSKASYRYDAFNRRIEKSVTHYNDGAANTETTEFLWLGTQLVAEYEQGSATPTKRYRYISGFAPVSYSEGDQHYSVHSDHLQTPQVLTDSQGNTAWQAELSPYGLLYSTSETANVTNQAVQFNLRFPGQYHDRESGLYYNLNRYYDPEQGRYVTSDPIGVAGGMNTYAYVMGNPIMSVDSLGLQTCLLTTVGPGGVRDHAAVYTSRGDGSGGPVLYDPAGSYGAANGGGSGGIVTDSAADIAKFTDFHKGQKVESTCKNTSQKEEESIINKAMDLPSASAFQCAIMSSAALSGQPSFPDVEAGTFWPGNLRRQVRKGP